MPIVFIAQVLGLQLIVIAIIVFILLRKKRGHVDFQKNEQAPIPLRDIPVGLLTSRYSCRPAISFRIVFGDHSDSGARHWDSVEKGNACRFLGSKLC